MCVRIAYTVQPELNDLNAGPHPASALLLHRCEFTGTKSAPSERGALTQASAQAQQRTEVGLNELRVTVSDLAQAQQKTEIQVCSLARTMEAGFRDLHNRFGVLGSRWGDRAEETFPNGKPTAR